jgi:hypothetical protein
VCTTGVCGFAGAEERDRFIDRHVEHLGDVAPAELVLEDRRLESPTLAYLARSGSGRSRSGDPVQKTR